MAPSTARELVVRVPTDDMAFVRVLDVFVARDADGALSAYENFCPHAGGALNFLPDKFFSRDGRHLLCTRHGAKFEPTEGLCVLGPCSGDALNALPFEVGEDGDVVARWADLRQLCDEGGGAFVLRPADHDEARGPPVERPGTPPPPPPISASEALRQRRARRAKCKEEEAAK